MNTQDDTQPKIHAVDDEAVIAEALTSDDPVGRIIGRAMASGWVKQMEAWLRDEQKRAGRKAYRHAELMTAFTGLQAQFIASLSVTMTDRTPEAAMYFAETYVRQFGEEFARFHTAMVARDRKAAS